ncbi:MAG: response regulator transcription factor [Nitrospirae bacterium]|nr:response regulator transcription factor [Nitrospirota bacterium]
MEHTYNIIIADDHVLFRRGLRAILEKRAGIRVSGEAGDGSELLAILGKSSPHMVILDISMPNLRGIETLREIKENYPDIKVLMLTMHKDREYLRQSIAAGADGYMLKEEADPALFMAIDKLRQDKVYVSPPLADDMFKHWSGGRKGNADIETELLSAREKEVLMLIAEGKSSREIAGLLNISVRTVDRHRINISDKLNIKKIADLVRYAIQKGYI